jgi:hypothetical protein
MRLRSLLITAALSACTVESPVSLQPGADGGPADVMDLDAGMGTDVAPTSDTATADVPTTTESAVLTPDAPCVDNDNDGYPATECGGMAPDCDDSNPMRNPGRTEVCDSMGVDEDCNPCTVAGASDGDGDRDTFLGAGCFNRYAGAAPMSCGPAVRIDGAMLRVVGRDCDDTDNNVRPDQTDGCNNRDDNCNGMIDEDAPSANWYLDRDGDGHASRTEMGVMACAAPSPRHVRVNDDCDDTDPLVAPSAPEVCDGAMRDENCNGMANEGCNCAPVGSNRMCCEGRGSQTCTTTPMGANWSACSTTSTTEVCDNIDNDCDGATDEGLRVTCYRDTDGDGFAPMGARAESLCPPGSMAGMCPSGFTTRAPTGMTTSDCDDATSVARSRFPENREVCDGVDNNCDSRIDETATTLNCGVGACARSTSNCVNGRPTSCVAGSPTGETCDNIDNDCNGVVDNGVTRDCGNSNEFCAGMQTCSAGAWGRCNAPRRCPLFFTRDSIGQCDFTIPNPGQTRSWRQGTAADNSTVATIRVPNEVMLDVSCYRVRVTLQLSQSSSYCPGVGGTAGEINNTISCDGGSTVRVPSSTFANGGTVTLTNCNPGGNVNITKTTFGEFFPGPCNRAVVVTAFSHLIQSACQCRWL